MNPRRLVDMRVERQLSFTDQVEAVLSSLPLASDTLRADDTMTTSPVAKDQAHKADAGKLQTELADVEAAQARLTTDQMLAASAKLGLGYKDVLWEERNFCG